MFVIVDRCNKGHAIYKEYKEAISQREDLEIRFGIPLELKLFADWKGPNKELMNNLNDPTFFIIEEKPTIKHLSHKNVGNRKY